ncbi:MAG: FliI/YscN family ATPase [Candidatus Sedimenticola sp. (ex Thyasira tokunagai)]
MLDTYTRVLKSAELIRRIGRVTQFFGLIIESNGPDVYLGERCEIYSRSRDSSVLAEVVGIKDGKVLLMPYEQIGGISMGSEVIATGKAVNVRVGEGLLGRVIDALGRPLDEHSIPKSNQSYPLYGDPINPLSRPRIDTVLETGVRSIDSLLTVGFGQRVGIFAGSGVGKSTLLGMIARHMNADVNVIALIGERGREVLDFIELVLGEEGLARTVVVVATSDQPALMRIHAAFTASAIAEYFRDQGKNVVLTMDSVTRFAMAQREIGLAIGEPPTSRGYTPSVFAMLPRLIERAGTSAGKGSITAFYTVLIEGDDMKDPIADSIRALVDGHIVLSRDLANKGHYPSVDILQSKSRLMSSLVSKAEQKNATQLIRALSLYQESKDMIDIGAYTVGTNSELDSAIQIQSSIEEFLVQDSDTNCARSESIQMLQNILDK